MRKSTVTVLAALAALTTAPVAAAETVSVAVGFDDLNLASPAGVATLEKRIKAAAEKVCAQAERRELWARASWQECKAATLADAMEQMASVLPAETLALAASAAN